MLQLNLNLIKYLPTFNETNPNMPISRNTPFEIYSSDYYEFQLKWHWLVVALIPAVIMALFCEVLPQASLLKVLRPNSLSHNQNLTCFMCCFHVFQQFTFGTFFNHFSLFYPLYLFKMTTSQLVPCLLHFAGLLPSQSSVCDLPHPLHHSLHLYPRIPTRLAALQVLRLLCWQGCESEVCQYMENIRYRRMSRIYHSCFPFSLFKAKAY